MFIVPASQRKFIRVHHDHYVDIEFVSDRYDQCQIKNLSLKGMFIEGDFTQHEGKSCHIDVLQTGISPELSLQALAKVVRKDDKGIAVEFFSMTFDGYMYLQTSLLNEAEDSLVFKKMLGEKCPFEVTDDFPVPPSQLNNKNLRKS